MSKTIVLMLLKRFGTDLLLELLEHIMYMLKNRDDNEVNEDDVKKQKNFTRQVTRKRRNRSDR